MSKFKSFEDNMLYKVSMHILEYVIISLYIVFITICSIGLLLMPALSSAYYFYNKQSKTKVKLQFIDLIKGFKLNFKQAFPLNIFVIIVLYIGYVNYTNFELLNISSIFYYPIMLSLLYLLLASFTVMQLITYFEVKLSKAIALSNLFIVTYFISTITVIILFIALVLSIALQPPLIIIILGVFVHLSSKIYGIMLGKHKPEEVTEDE